MKILILSLACLCAHAVPQNFKIPVGRNTIFLEDKLKGAAFADVDVFDDIVLYGDTINPYRLPTTTKPSHYNVLWTINITALAFSGAVNIELSATQANVSEIVIHAHDLNISALTLQQGDTVIPQTYTLEPEYHFLRVNLSNSVLAYDANNPVVYTLTISFSAPLREDLQGIYRSSFNDTRVSWLATTQFQATAARLAFPCYDEPSFKSTFDVTIRRPTAYRSWSAMRNRETRESDLPGYQEDIYHRTPVMSTYQLALIVAEYDSLELINNSVLKYEVIARPEAVASGLGDYAFQVGRKLLAEMSNYADYDYYSQNDHIKMTQAAVPDFSSGAMENWGLLTYREPYFLYDEHNSNSHFKQFIASILSHEIAHMWFGNLVTCDWWDVLWLNEGFARYFQYFLTHRVEDYMGFETRFITEQVHTSLLFDSSNNPHALTFSGIGSPASVSAVFSLLTYNKGAAVIRMTEHLLGSNAHRAGLRTYLAERQFKTALPIHLFETLERVGRANGALNGYGADFSLVEYYKSWTEQGGHPVLNVHINHQTGEMIIKQRRFNINTGYSTVNSTWIIPITFATASNPDFVKTKPTHIISKAVTSINRGTVGDQWVVFNKQQTGFYRVNYDDYTWNLIISALRSDNRTQIHEYNRAQIVNDVFQFARSGLMSFQRALNLLNFLEKETEYAPWVAALTGISWIRNRFAGTAFTTEIKNLLIKWTTRVMDELTYYPIEGETFMRSYLRYQLAPFLCDMGVAACRAAATTQFRALVDDGVEVPVDSRIWVYCNGLREGTAADFDFLWARFRQHKFYAEKVELIHVLGCAPHAASLNTFLNGIFQDNLIRPQDYSDAFISAVTGNEDNTQIVFTYVKNNLQAVIDAFKGDDFEPLLYISMRLRSEAEVFEFKMWATRVKAPLGQKSLEYALVGADDFYTRKAYVTAVQSDLSSYFNNETVAYTTSTAAPEFTT